VEFGLWVEKMKIKALIEALEKILKSYKKEIENSTNVNIIENSYYDEDSETTRRQIIIDYQIEFKEKTNGRKNDNHKAMYI
jgi:NMD protein affecting ribosome stability and mRNA decay